MLEIMRFKEWQDERYIRTNVSHQGEMRKVKGTQMLEVGCQLLKKDERQGREKRENKREFTGHRRPKFEILRTSMFRWK